MMEENRTRNPFPEDLYQMLVNPSDKFFTKFHDNIRILNNNFAFISTNAGFIGNASRKYNSKGGVPVIRIDGALDHLRS